jgi:hypothetical protein
MSQLNLVKTLKFNVRVDQSSTFRADAVLGDTIFEVLVDPRDLRRLRAAIVELAQIASADRVRRAVLIIDEPQISQDRLRFELGGIVALFQPEIWHRLTLVIRREGEADEIVVGDLSPEESDQIETVADHERQNSLRPARRPSEAFFDILRGHHIQWIGKSGPIAAKEFGEQAGFSYPTIAKALDRLGPYLHRHSDRRVALREFPREAWMQLVAQSEKVRASQSFADRSGRPRPPEVLIERLAELEREEVAVAGVLGARHYVPGLDLIGTPRLDLIIHKGYRTGRGNRKRIEPAALLQKLDPALVPAERGEPARVMVHTLFRPEPFFSEPIGGTRWADEVECLLDLHQARLEPQALEFLERLTPPPKS